MDTNMKFIQKEAKKRFPIGCRLRNTEGNPINILRNDYCTYEINGKRIWTHSGGGALYDNGKWAKLIDDSGNVVDFDNPNPNYEIY